jgi:hypothetical protein
LLRYPIPWGRSRTEATLETPVRDTTTEGTQMSRIAKAAVAAVLAAGLAIGAGGIPAGAASASHPQNSSFSDTGWD